LNIEEFNTYRRSSPNVPKSNKRGCGGPYLPTVVDPFNENPKRGRNNSYEEEDSLMESAKKPRKIKKIS